MPHSYAETTELTCSHCRQLFLAEIWLIVDASDRPDLVDLIRNNALHDVICSHCGEDEQLDAPLLLYTPPETSDARPPIIFSPSDGTSYEEDQQHFQQLLGLLQQRLGADWQKAWTDQGPSAIPRALLPIVVSDDPAAVLKQLRHNSEVHGQWQTAARQVGADDDMNSDVTDLPPALAAAMTAIINELRAAGVTINSPDDLEAALATRPDLQADLAAILTNQEFSDDLANPNPIAIQSPSLVRTVFAFIEADSWEESQRIVEQHPELLDDDAEGLFADLLVKAKQQNDADALALFSEHRDLLRRSRAVGIARAFAEKVLTPEALSQATKMDLTPEAFLAQLRASEREQQDNTFAIPGTVRPLLDELAHLTQQTDIPRRVMLCQQALQLVDRTANPDLYAALQFELANSLAQNPQGESEENLEQAIMLYEQVLQVRTRQAAPFDWALTTSNLANAYSERICGDRGENLERAIGLNEQALQVMNRQTMPSEWAMTMCNLADTYSERIRGERAENVEQAIALYEQALQAITRDASPFDWAETISNLAIAYRNRIRGRRAENVERAIVLYEQALQVRTRQSMPVKWAQTTMNLANAYADRIHGERGENLEQAIALYKQSLQVRTRQSMPISWATTTMNLAIAYRKRIHGERGENLERAIALFEQALQVVNRQAMPIDWAMAVSNLAIAYRNRIRGERDENLERAIALYEQALQIRTRQARPIDWAETTMNLANVYFARIRGDRGENVEQAIVLYEQALQVVSDQAASIEWAMTTSNLANAYVERIRGDRGENVERAIVLYEQALQVVSDQAAPIEWAMIISNLAITYVARVREERAKNLEKAIALYEQALQVRTRQTTPIEWAQTTMNLASAYVQRIRGGRGENLEQAIALFEQALQVITRQVMPTDWAAITNNLAIAYRNRIRGERGENLERAITLYEQALQVRTPQSMPIEWAETTMNLASAYIERIRGERDENLEQAIELYEQALQVRTRDVLPFEWAETTNNLASAYYARMRGERGENVEQAIELYKQALQVRIRQAMPIDWAQTTVNLATAYANRLCGEQGENIEQAIALYKQALQVFTLDVLPADHRQTQRSLGNLAQANDRWELAAMAFQGALTAGEVLYSSAATPEVRQAELREYRDLPAAYAYALARSQPDNNRRLTTAVVALERNRTRWLTESLALHTTQPATVPAELWQRFTATVAEIQRLQNESRLREGMPAKRPFLTLAALLATAWTELTANIAEIRTYEPEFMPMPDFADILHAFAPIRDNVSYIGVYLLTTSQGGLALIVHAGRITPVWLDTLTEDRIRTWLAGPPDTPAFAGWLGGYLDWIEANAEASRLRTDATRLRSTVAQHTLFSIITYTTAELWTHLMGPLAASLASLGLPSGGDQPPIITLIPTGFLALLPLHAAWTPTLASNGDEGAHSFLDSYAVHYAPSAIALRHCRERIDEMSVKHLSALDEPKPISGGSPLPNSAREVKAIASLFSNPTVLKHEQANRAATLDALAAAQVVHISCHGANNWRNPLDSGLLLANDEHLTVRDFLELQLPGARLATLSACETGIVGVRLPDEVIMLPSALVQAGYAGVVASLWSVADVSTAMLMVRFYQYWREEGLEPVYALRKAQRWVRDTTNGEKAAYFGQFVPSPDNRMAGTVAAEFFNEAMLSTDGLEARSFAHPFWWGAFYLTGV